MMWRNGPIKEKGFSLIELLIAMVVLAIGIMATMAMQFTALAGYTSAREMTGASEMVQTVEQMIRAESRQFNESTAAGSGSTLYTNKPYFLSEMMDSPGTWVIPGNMNTPMSSRLNSSVDDDGAKRFCVYVAGQTMPDDDEYIRVAIAVVYPGSNSQFPGVSASDPNGRCDQAVITGNLDRSDQRNLELEGLRVTRLSTAVRAFDS